MNSEDLLKLLRQHVDQYKNANPDITFTLTASSIKELPFLCDAAQISQVLTNLLLNAIESLREEKSKGFIPQTFAPKITVLVELHETNFAIKIGRAHV